MSSPPDQDPGTAAVENDSPSIKQESSVSHSAEATKEAELASNAASALSATAEPFKFSLQAASTQLSVFAAEFVPKAMPAAVYADSYQDLQEPDYGELYGESEKSDPLLDYAFQVLNDITFSPGQFSRLCDQLLSTLNSWPTLDETILQILVDEIVAQAIKEPNFRYNGARLCNAISRGLRTYGPPNTDFRSTLFNRCRMIHDERKNLMQSDADYLRGFALFMSELFIHMSPKDSSGRFRVLGRAVRELLLTLLEHPTPGNLKCLCQILKLSGADIEDDDREANKGKAIEMDMLMTKIDNVGRTVDMQMHLKDLLLSMIELRAKDWGRAPTSPVTRESRPIQQQQAPRMGVFYGPDGQALTAEEAEFLDQGINRQGEEEEYDYHEEEDTGMDEEMTEAFEKFLMMQEALK